MNLPDHSNLQIFTDDADSAGRSLLIVAHLKFKVISEDAFELRQSLSHHFQLFSGHTCP